MPSGNIYLTGFSGTGKSNSGRQAADLLRWEFFEMDDRIEARTGKKIPEIFAGEGEERFRQIETEVLREAASKAGVVVSTGGGVPTREENRRLMAQTGVVIRLKASPETIHARLSGAAGPRGRALRPLLGSDAPVEKVRELLEQREAAYATADADIDTEGRRHDEVARLIVDAWRRLAAQKGFSSAAEA
jgi:shikimate kinase